MLVCAASFLNTEKKAKRIRSTFSLASSGTLPLVWSTAVALAFRFLAYKNGQLNLANEQQGGLGKTLLFAKAEYLVGKIARVLPPQL